MLRSAVFPYGISFSKSGSVDIFPAAKVFFPYKDGGEVPLFLLIDSGAVISVLPLNDAEALGIKNVKNGDEILISGISGKAIKGWQHEILVRLETDTVRLPTAFLEDELTPRILGRAGIFERFTIIFEERGKRTGFLGNDTQEYKQIGKTLDQIQSRR